MTVEERRRIELFEQLVAELGEEAATTMLELLPPPGADVATKDDIAALRRDMVTKDDIRDVVRKDDLRDFVRKDDLAHLATKGELYKTMATLLALQTAALAGLAAAAAQWFA